MTIPRRSSPPAALLLALSLGACSKKETPRPEPAAPATLPAASTVASATASATASASAAPPVASATASASAAPPASTRVVRTVAMKLPAGEEPLVYVQIEHPNKQAADALNRTLKAEAAKKAAEKAEVEKVDCSGAFPAEDIVFVACLSFTANPGHQCGYGSLEERVWSLAGKAPLELELDAQLNGDWLATAAAVCAPQLYSPEPIEGSHVAGLISDEKSRSWHPEKDGLPACIVAIGVASPPSSGTV